MIRLGAGGADGSSTGSSGAGEGSAGGSAVFDLGDLGGGILVVFTSSNNPCVGGEVCSSGSDARPIFFVRALTTEGGGGTVPEAGLKIGLVGRGAVMGSVAGDEGGAGGEAGADLMGTVFAVRALINDGKVAFFGSCCGGGGGSGTAEAGVEGGFDGGAMALVGSGAVFWASAFTNDARDTFFVP